MRQQIAFSLLLTVAGGLLPAEAATANGFPNKAVRIIVPAGAGSPTDLRARQMSPKFMALTGHPLVVDNRPGANQFIAAEAAARSPADGHTLFFGNVTSHAHNPWLFRVMPYRDQEDFVPVTMISGGYLMMAVHPAVPARSVNELVALAKARPGSLNYGTVGSHGSPALLVMEQLRRMSGLEAVAVPYKSTGAELADLASGQIQIGFNFWPILRPYIESGKLRALAVASPRRLEAAPTVPTFEEAGLSGIESFAWNGIFVPSATPRDVIGQLHQFFARILEMPDIRASILESGATVGGSSPEAFAAFVRAERTRWGRLIGEAGLRPQ